MPAYRVIGSNLWGIVAHSETKQNMIALFTLKNFGERGVQEWGYKGITEDMGPYLYGCPLSLVAQCDEPCNENAAEWRQANEKHFADKAALPEKNKQAEAKFQAGFEFEFGGQKYKTIRVQAFGKVRKKNFFVCELMSTGTEYKFRPTQVPFA